MGTSLDRFLQTIEPGQKKDEAPRQGPIERWATESDTADRISLADSVSAKQTPQQAARALTLARQTGLEPDVVERNLPLVEEETRKQSVDAEAFARDYPNVAKWLAQQPQHIALARDDLKRLGYIERQVKHIGEQFTRGKRLVELSKIGERAMFGRLTPDDRKRQAEIEKELGQTEPDYGFSRRFERIPGAVANQLPLLAKSLKGGIKGAIGGATAGAGAALAIGQAGPQAATPEEVVTVPALASRGAVLGARGGLAIEAGMVEANLAYLDYEKLRNEEGIPLDRETLVGAAAIVGVVNGALETVGIESMLKNVPGVRALGREGIKRALQNQTTREAFIRYAKTVGAAIATEGGTEFVQSLVTSMAGAFARMVEDGSINTVSTGAILDALADAAAEAEQGALAGGGITATVSTTGLAADVRRARDARRDVEFFKGLGEATRDATIIKAAPEKAEEVIAALTRDGPVERLYTPVEVWQEYWQSQEIDPAEMAEEVLGSRDAYDDAVRTGADLAIPTSRYATYLAPTKHNDFFERELKTDPDKFSAREAEEWEASQEETEQATEEAKAEEAPVATVEQTVMEQLTASGFDPQTAQTYASLYGSTFRALGERTGQDPLSLFQRFNLSIERPEGIPTGPPLDLRKLSLQEVAQRAMAMREMQKETETERAAIQAEAGTVTRESLYDVPIEKRDLAATTAEGQFAYARERGDKARGNLRKNFKNVSTEGLVDEIAKLTEEMELESRIAVPSVIERVSEPYFKPWVGMKGAAIMASGRLKAKQKAIDRAEAELASRGVADVNERVFARIMGREFVEGGEALDTSFDFSLDQPPIAVTGEEARTMLEALGGRGFALDLGAATVEVPQGQRFADATSPQNTVAVMRQAMSLVGRERFRELAEAEIEKRGGAGEAVVEQAAVEETARKVAARVLFQSAFHGSPHIFDKFSLQKIGTGEGAQAFGWGLYFTSSKAIADYYRKSLSSSSTTARYEWRGQRYEAATPEAHALSLTFYDGVQTARRIGKEGLAAAQAGEPWAVEQGGESYWSRMLDTANAITSKKEIKQQRGRIYKVDIPHDDTMILWEKPLKDQPQPVIDLVRAKLKELKYLRPEENGPRVLTSAWRMYVMERGGFAEGNTGGSVYAMLTKELGSEEQASRHLASLGITGLKYPAGSISGASKGDYNYVIFDDQLIDIIEYEQRKQNIPRGRIKIGESSINIELLKDADLSTFLHETGHFYLQVLETLADAPDADGSIANDLRIVRDWVGAEESQALTREQHETFARGFERYLLEGKAPSSALRTAFARFRAWLVWIYKSARNLNVELTPEVRGVFDRLVATEEEIAAVEAESRMVSPALDPIVATMGSQTADYIRAEEDARRVAEEELSAKLIREYQREISDQWKAERVRVMREVADEVNVEPASLAYSVLGRGTLPDGAQIPEDVATRLRDDEGKLPKLSRQALEAEYATRPEYTNLLKRLPRPYVYRKEGGIHPDQAADLFGFRSGDEMIQALLIAEPPRKRIERLTDERMRERHSDELLSPEDLTVEAQKAVHNEKRAELMHRKLRHLVSQDFATFKKLARRVSRRVPPIEAVRAEAEAVIARQPVREIRPIVYQRAEMKARKAAVEAFLKGDFSLAFDELLRELYSYERYRAALTAKDRVEGIVTDMARFSKRSVRERLGKAGADYLDQIDAIRERYDFARGLSRAQVQRRKTLLRFVEEQEQLGIPITVPQSLLEEAGRTHYTELTLDELVGLHDTVRQIEHLARTKNDLLANKRKRELEEARDEIVSTIGAYHDISQKPAEHVKGVGDRLAHWSKVGLAEHTRMEFLFEALDGGKAQGAVWQHFFKPFADAEGQENDYRRKDAVALKEIFGKYTRAERNKWFSDRINIPEATSLKSSPTFTKAHLLSIALNWGNDYNRAALMEGYGWNEAQVERLLDRLDGKDWGTVQAIWDHIDSYWPEAQALEREITGLAPEKVEAKEIVTKLGTFRGGYYPIVFDREQSTRQAALDEAANVKEMFGGLSAQAMTRHGHLKERTNTGGKPLLLDLSVIPRHLAQVTHDLAYRRAVIDVSRLIRDPQISSAIERAVGTEMFRQLGPWVKAIAGDRPKEHSSWYAGLASRARGGATVVSLGLKVTSSLMQTLGYATTVNVLGPKYASLGMRDAFKNGPRIWKLVEEDGFVGARSSMMRDRMQNYDRDVRDYSRKLSNITGEQAGWFVLIGYMDLAMAVPTWLGAYRKAMDGGLENVDKGDELAAIDYADSVVRTTQAAGAAKDLASIQRGDEVFRLFTMFYSSLSLIFNQFERTRRQFMQDHNVPRLIASLALLWFVPALMEDVLRGRMPDEDDDESWLGWLIGNLATYPLATVVGVRDLANYVERKITTGQGDFAASPAFEAVEKIGSTLALPAKPIRGDDITRGDVKDAVLATGYVLKLPSRQMWQTGEAFYDWWQGDYEPESIAQGLWESVVTGRQR